VQPPGDKMSRTGLSLSNGAYYSNSAVRYMITKDEAFNTYDFDPRPYAKQITAFTKLMASDDPNLSPFMARGGKLIILHNTADAAITSASTMNYFDAVTAKLGKEATDKFARLYIVPGGDHGGGGTPSKTDLLTMLDDWVVSAKAPGDNGIVEEDGPDMKPIRTKPLCAYPYYPRYVGAGDPKAAASYHCVVARP
jgi:hypothetical protein